MSFQSPTLPPGADSEGLFLRRRVIITAILAFLGIVIAVLTSAFDDTNKAAPDATLSSESAIGQKAFLVMIDELQLDRINFLIPLLGAFGDGLTIYMEPNPSEIAPADLKRRLTGKAALIVLPKWIGVPDLDKPRHIEAAVWMEKRAVEEVARVAAADITIVRSAQIADFPKNDFRVQPLLTRPQLMRSAKLTPLISSENGILLGQVKQGNTLVYVLSDPDLLNNHGLLKGNNAILVVRMIEKMRTKGLITLDTSVQKMRGAISLWRQLFLPPLLGLLLLSLAAVIVLIWHTAQRLMPPRKLDFGLASGKLGLVENSAALFDAEKHRRFLKQRYLDGAIAEIAAVIPGIARLQGDARAQALEQLSSKKSATDGFTTLLNLISSETVSASIAARRIHIWKQEILRGLI